MPEPKAATGASTRTSFGDATNSAGGVFRAAGAQHKTPQPAVQPQPLSEPAGPWPSPLGCDTHSAFSIGPAAATDSGSKIT